MALYEIVEKGKAIKCKLCDMVSWHPKDVEHKYCGNCHLFLEDHARYLRYLKLMKEQKGKIYI